MKKLLLVIDYQNDFITGSLGFKEAAGICPAILEKIKLYRDNGDEIAYTMDTHGENYSGTQEGQKLPVPHCIVNTDGWRIQSDVFDSAPKDATIFKKPTFGSREVFEYLTQNAFSSIELCGLVTNICVISNAVLAKTAQPETRIIVDAKCVASNDAALNQKALQVMESFQVEVLNN